jgi:hypothetical protein
MRYRDGRFTKHLRWRFYIFNIIMRQRARKVSGFYTSKQSGLKNLSRRIWLLPFRRTKAYFSRLFGKALLLQVHALFGGLKQVVYKPKHTFYHLVAPQFLLLLAVQIYSGTTFSATSHALQTILRATRRPVRRLYRRISKTIPI